MRIVLWILQLLLAAQFFWHGWILTFPPAEYVEAMNENMAVWFRLFLGIAEMIAALAIILPGLLRSMTWLVPLSAAGMLFVAVSATVWHFLRGENSSAYYTLVLVAITTFVAWMRWKVKPIMPRQSHRLSV
ncbi:MAG: DoxX family protein [Flavisolibacter sp.]